MKVNPETINKEHLEFLSPFNYFIILFNILKCDKYPLNSYLKPFCYENPLKAFSIPS